MYLFLALSVKGNNLCSTMWGAIADLYILYMSCRVCFSYYSRLVKHYINNIIIDNLIMNAIIKYILTTHVTAPHRHRF